MADGIEDRPAALPACTGLTAGIPAYPAAEDADRSHEEAYNAAVVQMKLPLRSAEMDCPEWDSCAAPLCPLSGNLAHAVWFPDEPICKAEAHGGLRWVKTQVEIAALPGKTRRGYFSLAMLQGIRHVGLDLAGRIDEGGDVEGNSVSVARSRPEKAARGIMGRPRKATAGSTGRNQRRVRRGRPAERQTAVTGRDRMPKAMRSSRVPGPAGQTTAKRKQARDEPKRAPRRPSAAPKRVESTSATRGRRGLR